MTAETGLAKLREDFPAHQISKLPKQMRKDDQDKGKCSPGSKYTADGYACGGFHARSIHLDYVGHAALTDRLLDADNRWSWEPVAFGEDGLPAMDKLGGLWIRLTVCGVTRLGYGDAQGKTGPNAVKEAIGDALRNAAMRFGAALTLWHKGDLRVDAEQDAPEPEKPKAPDARSIRAKIAEEGRARKMSVEEIADDFAAWSEGVPIAESDAATLQKYLDTQLAPL